MKLEAAVINILFLLVLFFSLNACKDINPNINLDLQLRNALEEKNKPLFKKLLKAGANPNIIFNDGYWVMGDVIEQPDLDFLKLAIEYGGDVNLKNEYIRSQTPIFVAELVGNIKAIDFLLNNGASPNIMPSNGGAEKSVISQAVGTMDYKIAYLVFEHKGTLKDYEIESIIWSLENLKLTKKSEGEKYKNKFIKYLRSEGYEVNPDKKPECYNDPICKQIKKYKHKIERCNIVKSNPPEDVPTSGIKKFLDKCEKNMSMYLEKAGQSSAQEN